jgi:hypothetical protein
MFGKPVEDWAFLWKAVDADFPWVVKNGGAMSYSIQEAAAAINVKPDVIRRAIELGAIRLTEDTLIAVTELTGFAAKGFKHNRYDGQGRKLPGAKN